MKIIIDGKLCESAYGEYILDVARRNNIHIPTLCHSEALPGQGNCRLCVVEVVENHRKKVVTACVYPITKEIEVITNSDNIKNIRKTILMLLSARVPENKYINEQKEEYGVLNMKRFHVDQEENCILCGLCVRACEEMGSSAIATVNRGITKKVSTPYDEPSSECIGCGACAHVCPTEAIKIEEKDGKRTLWNRTFELIKCSKCGKYFATKEELEYIHKRLDSDEDMFVCSKCKQHLNAKKMKDVLKDVAIK